MPATAPSFAEEAPTRTGLLASARSARAARDAAEVALLVATIEWCAAHRVTREDQAAWLAGYGEHGLSLGGRGCPLVRESAVTELAAALGLSTAAGTAYVGEALELRYRLPRLWERVLAGACPVWRARRVAARTTILCEDGADHVDTHVAGFAHSLSLAQLERVLDDTLLRFDPDQAETRRRAASESRRVDLDLDRVAPDGIVQLRAGLDLADAIDLEAAVSDRAHTLGRLGCAESLPVRRSLALGDLARGQAVLGSTDIEAESEGTAGDVVDGRHRPRGRQVVAYLHLSRAAITGCACGCDCTPRRTDPTEAIGRLDGRHPTRSPISTEVFRDWCSTAAQITIRPVLDLAETIHCESYEASDRLKDQTVQRDGTCVFPFCTRPASACDQEHPVPWPAGPTATHNQAAVCRKHHRHKTHLGWSYTVLTPGLYLWTSPTGLRYLRSHVGTHEIDKPTPPAQPPEPLAQEPPPPRRVRVPWQQSSRLPAGPATSSCAGSPSGPTDEVPPPF